MIPAPICTFSKDNLYTGSGQMPLTKLSETNNSVVYSTRNHVIKQFKYPEKALDHQHECNMARSILQQMGIPTRTSVQLFLNPDGIWTMTQPRFTCDLHTLYYERPQELGWSSSLIVPILRDVYSSLGPLWEHFACVHGDVKPANIMVHFRGPVPRFVLWDYGSAESPSYAQYNLGPDEWMTLWYRAPERRTPHKYNQSKIDIWSMGVLTVALLGGIHLFQGRTTPEQFQLCESVHHSRTASGNGRVETLPERPPVVYPAPYIPLVKLTLKPNPFDRSDVDRMLLILQTPPS